MKPIFKLSAFLLSFLAFSFGLAYINLDVDTAILWSNYLSSAVPSLLISGGIVFFSSYLEKRRKED